jgi:hypothetical protein
MILWLIIPFLFEMSLESAIRLLGVREGDSFEEILRTTKTMCWKIYG